MSRPHQRLSTVSSIMLYVDLISAEYGERPLKLVLKVSGNEVTTGSSSLDTFYDEQPDKPKDKKKKKKKDKERSFGSPEDDRGKKKVTLTSLDHISLDGDRKG